MPAAIDFVADDEAEVRSPAPIDFQPEQRLAAQVPEWMQSRPPVPESSLEPVAPAMSSSFSRELQAPDFLQQQRESAQPAFRAPKPSGPLTTQDLETRRGQPIETEQQKGLRQAKEALGETELPDADFFRAHPELKSKYGGLTTTDMPAPRLTTAGAAKVVGKRAAPYVAGAEQFVADVADFMTSLPGIATVGGGAVMGAGGAATTGAFHRAALTTFAADMARNSPEQFAGIVDAIKRGDKADATRQLLGAGATALVVGGAIKANLPKTAAAFKQATETEVSDASKISPTTTVHGDVRPLETPTEALPAKESGAGVQPPTGQLGQAQPLSPEHQSLLDNAHDAAEGVPVVLREPEPGEPFAQAKSGQIATIDRQRGTIVVNPAEFSAWLNEDMAGLAPERQRLAVRSMLAEERNHLATSDEHAAAYWGTLSAAEKAIEQKLYTTKFKGAPDVSPTDLGFEAIRRRFQQLARMDSTEVAQRAGAERWGYRSLEILNNAIRGIRETLGTKASKEGLAILDKVQANLDAARVAVGASQPAALRKPSQPEDEGRAAIMAMERQAKDQREAGNADLAEGLENNISELKRRYPNWEQQAFPAALRPKRKTEPEGQQGFFLPETKGKGVLSKPPTQPATAGSPELRGKPVNALDLENETIRHLSETSRPNFETFASEVKRKYGSEIRRGQLRDLWQEQVWKRLQGATGAELGRLRDQLGLGREVGTHPVADAPAERAPGAYQLEAQPTKEVKELDAAGRERQIQQQRYRANVEGRIGEKLIAEAETGRKAWRRAEVTPEEVATWRESSEGAFRPVTSEEAASHESLGRTLTEGAAMERSTVRRTARGGQKVEVRKKAPEETVTKRVTALLNKTTGKVELVGTYRSGRAGAMLVDPIRLGRERPHTQLARLLSRYQPIYSVLLDEPVQNFHQSFESVRDFEERFGAEARRRAQEASQTAEAPAAATEAQPEPPGALERGKPLQDAEAGAVLDHILAETGKFDSPDDVGLAINGLANDVKRMPSAKLNWPALLGFVKIYNAIREKWPVLDHDQAMAQMAEELYDRHKKVAAFDEFVSGATRDYQREGKEAVRGSELGPAQAASGGRAAETGARELTVPRFARKGTPGQGEAPPVPTATPGEVKPPEMLTPEEQAFVDQESAIKAAKRESEPAALRPLREAKERTLAEAERLKIGVGNLISRREIKDEVVALRDVADNTGNNIGREAERDVREFSSVASKSAKPRKEVLNGLMPMVTSHAITADYDLKMATPEARKLFLDMTYRQPKWKAATMKRMSPDPVERAEGQWIHARMKADAYGRLIEAKELRAENARYGFDENAVHQLDIGLAKIDAGAAKLRAKRATGGWLDKWQAGHDLKVLQKMREDLMWVKRNWADGDLRSGALEMRRQLDFRYQREADNGYNLRYDQDYVPGRYEGELYNDQAIIFPGIRILGKQWRSAKTFETMYDAAEAGYVPVTRDGANIVGHRARQGERSIQYKIWTENLRGMTDPVSGLPVSVEAKRGPDGRLRPPSNEYRLMTLRQGDDPVAVHEAYEKVIDQMTSQSRVQEFAPARIILELEQRLKHTLLVGDFFHLGRLSYYAGSIMGRKAGFSAGRAALDYSDRGLAEALRQGHVTQREFDYVNEKVPVRQGAATIMRTRRELAKDFQGRGLNVGQIQDALYKDLTGNLPLIGPYNKWLFDSYTRGLMMESALHEFERLNKAHPEIDAKVLMRDIAKDTNRFFGSIGRQGWFKSRTWQDISRLAFLAPQWVEGLVMKEAGFAKRLAYTATGAHALGLPGGREGLPAMGTLGKGIASGLLTMLVLTQAINLAWRRKPTWENEEEGHKFDAWIPDVPGLHGTGKGFFFSPLSVFNELGHDLVRYFETKPKAWDAFNQIGQNKLSPFGRLGLVLATSKAPTGEYQTTTGGVLGQAARQLAPAPISFATVGRGIGHAVAPGLISPPQPGGVQRQMLQWAGFKTETAGSASQRVAAMAKKFQEANGLGRTGFQFETTDQPSYVKLRSALRNGDEKSASKIMQEIGKSPTEIGKAMKNWKNRPWTGSKKSDNAFYASLTDAQMETVSQAQLERQQLYEQFLDFLSAQL